MTLLKHGVAAAITLAGALAFSGVALAAPTDFIDHGHYTTDTNNGLDWLDVTISVNQSYNYVSSQFGSGGEYEGWRYATGVEFNRMVSSWTGSVIADTYYLRVTHPEGNIDGLHFLLGSTLDTYNVHVYGLTYDERFHSEEGATWDYTLGTIDDLHVDRFGLTRDAVRSAAYISDNDIYRSYDDKTVAHSNPRYEWERDYNIGNYLVRDTLAPVPVPAAVWLMGSGLLGLLGYSRHRKPTIAD